MNGPGRVNINYGECQSCKTGHYTPIPGSWSTHGAGWAEHDFLQLWSGPDREMMAHFMEAVRFDGAPGIIRGRGETLTGQRVEVEITLMPLVRPGTGAHGDTPRLLGLYQTLGGEPMLKGRPIWRHRISMLVPPDTHSAGPQLRLVTSNA